MLDLPDFQYCEVSMPSQHGPIELVQVPHVNPGLGLTAVQIKSRWTWMTSKFQFEWRLEFLRDLWARFTRFPIF